MAQFYLGKSQFTQGNFQQAIECYNAAKVPATTPTSVLWRSAEALRNAGDPQGALNVLDQLFGPIEQTAEYLYQRGATVAALGGNPREVVALYERAVETHERHPGALFGLALENDRRGNDEAALDLYRQAAECFPTHVGVLLNLGLLYEDAQKYERAQLCYQRILDAFPDHSARVCS